MKDAIKITKVSDGQFVVEWNFANGWQDAISCSSEGEARTFAQGFCRGVTAVKNMIAVGPHFTGRIEQVA